ncbi:MAG: site-specific integrase [Bacteroidetes bacterium]|mgnify:CR=1 FL=1|jgi:integrase/recombinase XerD|nr:site-specific integrase [Bacteroidota bacterium]MBT5530242.1 site-specific integrase [Cytophagia bacterium]MBT4729650.1 site-specific integrase [Bacteroidota bacterium]MBT4968514.1 site-specific integrase [Bacteroidota bacterium]MBT7040313.1 site-specific integrase [Bacteroidota bacterium]
MRYLFANGLQINNNMTTTTKILLDQRRQKSNGTFPIIIRLSHNRKSTSFPLNIFVFESDWDSKKCRIKKACKHFDNLDRVNNMIQKKQTEFSDKIIELRDNKRLNGLTVAQLKKILSNRKGDQYFCVYAIELAESMERKGEIGNAKVYRHAESFIKRHNKNSDIKFAQITYGFLKKVEEKYLSKERSLNGLSTQMRTVRAIYNKAIKEGLAAKAEYPFEHYSIRSEETQKRAISKDDIKKIEDAKFPEDSSLWHARNYFLFSFYCRGMNFIDMVLLQKSNIVNGIIIYRRSKSKFKKLYRIKISSKAQEILDQYIPFIEEPTAKSYIFPIIKSKTAQEIRLEIENARGLYNKKLKKIGESLDLPIPLTSYVARHTWASTAKKLGFSVEVIGDGLGHTNTKTTQIYLESFGDDVLDDANESIIE